MPSQQIQSGSNGQAPQTASVIINKTLPPSQPPNKLPPPPPPPPPPNKPPPPPPPPPPPKTNRAPPQLPPPPSSAPLNGGTNGANGNVNCVGGGVIGTVGSNGNGSVGNVVAVGNGGVGGNAFSNMCGHQGNLVGNVNVGGIGVPQGCVCSNSGCIHQHGYANSSSVSDNGSYGISSYNQDNRGTFIPMHCNHAASCNNVHHSHNLPPRCQAAIQNVNSNPNLRINTMNGNSITTTASTINRNALLCNATGALNTGHMAANGCNSDNLPPPPPPNRGHCPGVDYSHHHHHHNLNNVQLSSNSNLSSLQPVDPSQSNSTSFHRCNMMQSSNPPTIPGMNVSEQAQRPITTNHCIHAHRPNGCNSHHHQATGLCNHHIQATHVNGPQQQTISAGGGLNSGVGHSCGNCSQNGTLSSVSSHQHNLISLGKTSSCPSTSSIHHHYTQEVVANRSSDASNNDSLLSTAHTHNLSNSSTTTHTSNVAVKQQPVQYHRPVLSRGTRSSSSQHYDQYGPSSAASTSSATASLSSYQMPVGFEDLIPMYPSTKINQPLPPLPANKSRISSPATQMIFNNGTNNMPTITSTFLNMPQSQQQQQYPQSFNQTSLPPLPPKPVSPNASSCSTQITTIRTSPSLLNQPITRVTSQAGVQNPLPNSDVPPPLPPLNGHPGSRNQPLVNSLMTRISANDQVPTLNPITNFMNMNLNRTNDGMLTEVERKTEALTRQVELELEQQQVSGEPLGICPKCGNKVMPAQEACKAMNQIYHATCFVCCECNRTLLGKTFYPVGDKVYCEEDFKYTGHMQSLERCAACSQPIFNMILPAMGKSYHPKCFKCCICGQCLDGVPFTIDSKNKIYCVKDYHSIHSLKCAACGEAISPIDGTSETVRVVSMGKNYHVDCFACEDCGLQLTDEESSRSYPLDNHLLCEQCHINRLSKMQAALSLS